MKAIQTKYLGATDTKPSRIKASAEGVPSKTYSKDSLWKPHGGSGNVVNYHIEAAKRFAVENSWPADLASGGLPLPDVWVHCFIPKEIETTPKATRQLREQLSVARNELARHDGCSRFGIITSCVIRDCDKVLV